MDKKKDKRQEKNPIGFKQNKNNKKDLNSKKSNFSEEEEENEDEEAQNGRPDRDRVQRRGHR